MSGKRVVEVRLEALVDFDELEEEDQELSESYEFEIDNDVSESQLANVALDKFHTSIAVSVLDDFNIDAFYKGELLEEDESVEPYSTVSVGEVRQNINDLTVVIFGADLMDGNNS